MKKTIILFFICLYQTTFSQLSVTGIGLLYSENSGDGEYGNVGMKSSNNYGIKLSYDYLSSTTKLFEITVCYTKGKFLYDQYRNYYYGTILLRTERIEDVEEDYSVLKYGLEFSRFINNTSIYIGASVYYLNCFYNEFDEDVTLESFGLSCKFGYGKPKGLFIEGGFDYFTLGENNYLKFPGLFIGIGVRI